MEVLIALTIFITIAAFATTAARSTLRGVRDTARRAEALDLARSVISLVEAGRVPIGTLNDPDSIFDLLAADDGGDEPGTGGPSDRWTLEIATQRSGFTGLVELEVQVFPRDEPLDGTVATAEAAAPSAGPTGGDDAVAPAVVLRSLVRLVGEVDDGAIESDDLLDGLDPFDPGVVAP